MDDSPPRETFAAEIDSVLLARLRTVAVAEGRPFHTLLEEAIGSLLDARSHVDADLLKAYESTLGRFGPVYEKLAK